VADSVDITDSKPACQGFAENTGSQNLASCRLGTKPVVEIAGGFEA
jgi:hypothetical protein